MVDFADLHKENLIFNSSNYSLHFIIHFKGANKVAKLINFKKPKPNDI